MKHIVYLPLSQKQKNFLQRLLKSQYFKKSLLSTNQEKLRIYIVTGKYPESQSAWLNNLGEIYIRRVIKKDNS